MIRDSAEARLMDMHRPRDDDRVVDHEAYGHAGHLRLTESKADADSVASAVAELQAQLCEAHAKIANVETALKTARRIGAAIGILMNQRQISEDEAFDLLRGASQYTGRKVRDVADEVMVTGTL